MASTLAVKGLSKVTMTELAREAKRFGQTTEQYVKQLLEERLAIVKDAREKTFAQIYPGAGSEVDEDALDKAIEAARDRHYRQTRRKK